MRAFPSAGNPALRDHQPAAPSRLLRRLQSTRRRSTRSDSRISPPSLAVPDSGDVLDRLPVILDASQSMIEEASLPQLSRCAAATTERVGRGEFEGFHRLRNPKRVGREQAGTPMIPAGLLAAAGLGAHRRATCTHSLRFCKPVLLLGVGLDGFERQTHDVAYKRADEASVAAKAVREARSVVAVRASYVRRERTTWGSSGRTRSASCHRSPGSMRTFACTTGQLPSACLKSAVWKVRDSRAKLDYSIRILQSWPCTW